MGKLRLLFVKEGRAVYISHLDLLRTFQRVFLRQGLVLRHSQGFHPHPNLSFALPLPVGQASDCELLDFETAADMDGGDLPERLNRFMPAGIRARSCYVPVWPVRELAGLECRVDLLYDGGVPAGAAERIEALLTGESLVIRKRTKRKAMADIDIRPMLHSLSPPCWPRRWSGICRSCGPTSSRCGGWSCWTGPAACSAEKLRES